jgi:hypothetical protein
LPMLTLLGMGLALNNTRAVLNALLGVSRPFSRTPKFAVQRREDTWVTSVYALVGDWTLWAELGLALFAAVTLAIPAPNWGFAPWLLLYACSFGYVGGLNLSQAIHRRRWMAEETPLDRPAMLPTS